MDVFHPLRRIFIVIGILCWGLGQVHAEGDTKEKARVYLGEGDELLRKGDRLMTEDKVSKAVQSYEAALGAYQKAYRSYPDKKIYFPIAMAEQKLGRFSDALEHYEALKNSGIELSDTILKQVDDGIEMTKDNLVGFSPIVAPKGAAVVIDGKQVGITPLSKVVYVAPGVHRYQIELDGYQTYEGSFDRSRGAVEKPRHQLKLISSNGTPNKNRTKSKDRRAQKSKGDSQISKTPLWIGLGATVILAGAATTTGIMASSKQELVNDMSLSLAERRDASDSGKSLALVTDGLIAGAVLTGAITTYYYFAKVRGKSQSEIDEDQAFTLAPYSSVNEAGLMVRGVF